MMKQAKVMVCCILSLALVSAGCSDSDDPKTTEDGGKTADKGVFEAGTNPDPDQSTANTCFPQTAEMQDYKEEKIAQLKAPFLMGSTCQQLVDGTEGNGAVLINFMHGSAGYYLTYNRTSFVFTKTSEGTIVHKTTGVMDTIEGLTEGHDITLTTHNGDMLVFSFGSDQVTVKSLTKFEGVVDPSQVNVVGGCLLRDLESLVYLRVFFDAPGLLGASAEADISGEDDKGPESFADVNGPIDGAGVVVFPVNFGLDEFALRAKFTVDSLELLTKNAANQEVHTDILAKFKAGMGQQDELDDDGVLTGQKLPAGTFQFNTKEHAAKSVVYGDCTPPDQQN